ncbi:hypothetical protein [Streptomyces hygroscopicus]|uniref:hypothetical protein n=1 Tax=Streptomyces hygroscopicus TaxID=1912 RepID=UPI00368D42D0
MRITVGAALVPGPAVTWMAPTSPKVGAPSIAAATTTLRDEGGSAARSMLTVGAPRLAGTVVSRVRPEHASMDRAPDTWRE